jgi:Transposase DNA-binding/Transposase DDE domain
MDWCHTEFNEVNFGDPRIGKRFIKVAQSLLDNPLRSISEATQVWSDAKAAYRLFANDKFSVEKLLKIHSEKTIQRCKDQPIILAIQDSSLLNYARFHSISDMGTIEGKNTWSHKGLILHPTLAVAPSGECFGLLDLQVYSRAAGIRRKHHYEHVRIPIHEKESYRWIKSFRTTHQQTMNRVKTVMVADREADIYELFHEAKKLDGLFLIRLCKDRLVIDDTNGQKKICKISKKLNQIHTSETYEIQIPRNSRSPARVAIMTIKHAAVTVIPPRRQGASRVETLMPTKLYVVSTVEENPPKSIEPLSWTLLTNMPINSIRDAIEKIEWYKLRWTIETYFKTLKSGFKIESTRLNREIKMKRFVSLICMLATRVMRLAHLERHKHDPLQKSSITEEFSTIEQKIINSIAKTKRKKNSAPDLYESIRIVAYLGGFLGRRSDGPPGVTVIWRGLQKLNDLAKYSLILEELVGKT